MSSAYHLAALLEAEPQLEIHGTAHILCDAKTASYLAKRMDIPASYAYAVLGNAPVKQAVGITNWCLSMPDPLERMRALRNWSARRGRTIDDLTYWQGRQIWRESRGTGSAA